MSSFPAVVHCIERRVVLNWIGGVPSQSKRKTCSQSVSWCTWATSWTYIELVEELVDSGLVASQEFGCHDWVVWNQMCQIIEWLNAPPSSSSSPVTMSEHGPRLTPNSPRQFDHLSATLSTSSSTKASQHEVERTSQSNGYDCPEDSCMRS